MQQCYKLHEKTSQFGCLNYTECSFRQCCRAYILDLIDFKCSRGIGGFGWNDEFLVFLVVLDGMRQGYGVSVIYGQRR